jgi:hypothetical protein
VWKGLVRGHTATFLDKEVKRGKKLKEVSGFFAQRKRDVVPFFRSICFAQRLKRKGGDDLFFSCSSVRDFLRAQRLKREGDAYFFSLIVLRGLFLPLLQAH